MLAYSLFITGWGWMGVVGSEEGVRQVVLPQSSPHNVHRIMRNGNGGLQDGTARFTDLCLRLKRYITGERVSFDDKLDTSEVSPFQQQVWEATRSIPWGETRTYGWVADRVGRPGHCRAVGQALASNPVPFLIPCHRVVGKSGCLTGYRGGLTLKKYLLDMESANHE
ncbi:MAG: methylated-DNA--[protein]-cysteine S-methyltransferase [Chloroflexi bacterium]|nr:methylated-DNA--[protein]-cysteine S-methyltransferase [Chloroflexota bacterium]